MKACRIEESLPLDEELEMAEKTNFMIVLLITIR